MGYFFIAIIAFAFGFVIGIKSKSIPKNREKNKQKSITDTFDELIVGANEGRQAPPPSPPSPPPIRVIKEGERPIPLKQETEHIGPGIMYDNGTFVKVNVCSSCKAIGHEYSLQKYQPCILCGGDVSYLGAAKWDSRINQWILSKA